MVRVLALLCVGMFIVSCGGGGGGNGGGGSTPPTLTFSPAAINEVCLEGDTETFSVTATPNPDITFTGTVYVRIIDNVGVINPNVQITANPDDTYTATFITDPSLTTGTHQGNFNVEVCHDSGCNNHYPGSPMQLPYAIEILSESDNLTTLASLSGASDWETFQGNAAHTGYVPAILDPADFSFRSRWVTPETGYGLKPVVTANDLVYVVSTKGNATNSKLYALNESDYSTAWNHDFGSVNTVNPPAVSGGNVYIATSGHSDTAMWSFTADTGTQRFSTPFNSQWEHYYAPTISDGIVYTNGGSYGGLNAFDTTDGSDYWFANLNQYDQWTPALDANYAYAYIGNSGMNIINKSTGVVENIITDNSFNWNGWSIKGSPIISDSSTVLSVNQANKNYTNHMISFDVSGLAINWSVSGKFPVNPALAGGVVYAANNSPLQLEAYDVSDGSLLWSWEPVENGDTEFTSHVIATDNLVFVSTDKRIYAIDIATRQEAWNYWNPGEMTISGNGILYIVDSSDGELIAINLH